ncbi:MAG: hypothetical protein ACREQQ_00005, partial [Candidatus Binatia bacterium]
GVLCAVLVAWAIEIAASPTKNYDALMYHLPTMANWYQTHSLRTLDAAFPGQSRYPYDWELLCTLFLMPFGEDFLVLLPNLVAWLVLGLSVYCLAIELGSRRSLALPVTLLALTMPIVHRHVVTPHTDLPLAAFFTAGVFFALRRSRASLGSDAVMAVFSLALVVGVRATGIVYGGLLVVTFLLVRCWPLGQAPAPPSEPSPPRRMLWIAAPFAALVGGFWQVRNFLRFPDTTEFLGIAFSGGSPGRGPVTARELSSIFAALDWTSAGAWRLLGGEIHENLGWQFPLLLFGVLAAIAAGALRSPDVVAGRRITLFLLALVTGLIFLATPWGAVYRRQLPPYDPPVLSLRMRFGLPFFGVLALLGGAMAGGLNVSDAWFSAVAIAVGLAGIADRVLLAVLCGFAVLGLIAPPLLRRLRSGARPWRKAGFVVTTLCLLLAVTGASFWLRQRRDGERVKTFGPVFAWLESNVGADEVVGYALSHRSYLLYGKYLRRSVVYVPGAPIDPEAGSRGAHDPLGRRRAFAPPDPNDLETWLRRLREERITVFAVGPVLEDWQSAPELFWLDRPDGPFTRVYGRDWRREMVLYRLRSAGESAVSSAPVPSVTPVSRGLRAST